MSLNILRCFCLALGFGLAASASASAAPFSSPRGYSLTPPPGWRVDRSHSPDYDVVIDYTQTPVATGSPAFRVGVISFASATTLENSKLFAILALQRQYPGLIIKSQTFSSLDGVRDVNLVLMVVKNGVMMRVRETLVLRNGLLLYVFGVAYPEKTHAKFDPMIAKMLASVHWKREKSKIQ